MAATISAQDQAQYYQTNIFNTSGATAAGIVTGAYGSQGIGGAWVPDLVGKVGPSLGSGPVVGGGA
jgi:hypothetical protein